MKNSKGQFQKYYRYSVAVFGDNGKLLSKYIIRSYKKYDEIISSLPRNFVCKPI